MTLPDIETALAEELYRIAPDIPLGDIDRTGDLREEFDIDSMDFLKLVTALGKRFDLPMPESDYQRMDSFESLTAYLQDELS